MLITLIALFILAGNIDGTVGRIMKDKALINQQTGALAVVAALKEQAAQAATYQTEMDQLLPTQDGLIGFSEWLNNAAAVNEVTTNMSFQGNAAPASDVAPGTAQFSFTATGAPTNLAAFLNDVETQASGFLVQITSFDMTSANGTYQVTGQGNVFFRS